MLPKYRELTDKFLDDLRKVKAEPIEYAKALYEVEGEITDERELFMDAEEIDPIDVEEDGEDLDEDELLDETDEKEAE